MTASQAEPVPAADVDTCMEAVAGDLDAAMRAALEESLETAALWSLAGVNSVVLNQWPVTHVLLRFTRLPSGRRRIGTRLGSR